MLARPVAKLEMRVVQLARSNGLRVIGPNAFGVANMADDASLAALFIPVGIQPGVLGLASQSGPLGGGVLNLLYTSGIGVSSFLGLGNQADVGPADVLQYWGSDDATKVIALYLDDVGDARSVAAEARVVSATKPILWVRPESDDLAEVLAQAGVILVDRVSELAEIARLVVDQPVPAGKRVAVISNASSVARLAVAACRRAGLDVVVPSSAASGDANAVIVNDFESVALHHRADLATFERVAITTAVSDEVDAIVVALSPTLDSPYDELSVVLGRIDRAVAKPLVAVSLAGDDQLAADGVPIYAFPEEAANALGRYAEYGYWRRTHSQPPFWPHADEIETFRAAVGAVGDGATLTMLDPELRHLLDVFGIDLAPYGVVGSHFEARQRAGVIGYPVVVKAGGVAARRPGEEGGVALDLGSEGALIDALRRMEARFGDALYPVIVQKMARPGVALRIELEQRPATGSIVSVSLGGSAAELSDRRLCRALPASVENLQSLVDDPWLHDLLDGPGVAAAFVDVAQALVRVGEATSISAA
ncbi:MAG: acetate--CoA ligase family protein [Acidimicrobiales bacterium]